VPADQQRYWVWQLRQNKTYRPTQRLKADEERSMIVDLREHREMSVSSSRGTHPGGGAAGMSSWPATIPYHCEASCALTGFFTCVSSRG
jgi:hypothetical protein